MSQVTIAQNAFTSGEWSPRLYGRSDLQKYASACTVLENMTILPHGATQRRMGTEYITNGLSESVVLVPFVFNQEQAYVLELTPKQMRIFRAGGVVTQGGTELRISTPWNATELKKLGWAQSADVMYFCCGTQAPRVLSRSGADVFSLALVNFTGQPSQWEGSNWPTCVTFYQQRLWFAATPKQSQSLWASKINEFTNFTVATDDTSALAITLASNEANAIRWLMSSRALLAGTSGGEWVISSSGGDSAMTAKNLQARRNSNYGTVRIAPLMVGSAIIHVSGDGRRVRELGYSYADDAYVSTDISLLGEHITRPGIVCLAHAPDPDGIIWAVTQDGQLSGCTYLREQDVVGWHRHPTQGEVLACTCIPADFGSELWLAVKRQGTPMIERMKPSYLGESANEEGCWYVDSGLQYSGQPSNIIRGLGHLESQKLAVLADGGFCEAVVTDGKITLPYAAKLVIAGLPIGWRLAPMPPEGSSRNGSAQGKRKRTVSVTVRLWRSLGVEYRLHDGWGNNGMAGQRFILPGRDVAGAMDAQPDLFTGDISIPLPEAWNRDGRFELSGDMPYPATILMTVPEVISHE